MMLAVENIDYAEPVTKPALQMHHIESARQLAAASGRHLLDVMEDVSGLSADDFVAALATLMHYQVADIVTLHQMTPDFDRLSFQQASHLECIALRDDEAQLYLACANPVDPYLAGKLELIVGGEDAVWLIAHRKDIAAFLGKYEESMRAMDGLVPDTAVASGTSHGIEDISLKTISEDTSPVVKLVRSTLYDAVKAGASDIHMETDPSGLTIKYRIDGVLNTVASVQSVLQAEQAISRIKVMSELDIAERRVPQDGRFKVLAQGREIDLRVSIMPSVFGEDAVLRILDRKSMTDEAKGLTLDVLGFEAGIMARFRLLAEEPYGMLLVTGPTGSGKTTTLYGIISEINHGQDKIVTIEDPVEYQLPGVLQIPVNEKKGLTFARGLRSILRHDPDRVMVGEIRDAETAQIAIQAALTGHLVFTTVHANNVFDVLGRFSHMGIDTYSFTAALNGIVAQRLVRRNCPHCSVEIQPSAERLADAGLASADPTGYRFMAGRGCGQCRGTGFLGRVAIAEILVMTDELSELIITRQPVRLLKEAARRNGTRLLRDAALDLLREGQTSLEEVDRVTTAVA